MATTPQAVWGGGAVGIRVWASFLLFGSGQSRASVGVSENRPTLLFCIWHTRQKLLVDGREGVARAVREDTYGRLYPQCCERGDMRSGRKRPAMTRIAHAVARCMARPNTIETNSTL